MKIATFYYFIPNGGQKHMYTTIQRINNRVCTEPLPYI